MNFEIELSNFLKERELAKSDCFGYHQHLIDEFLTSSGLSYDKISHFFILLGHICDSGFSRGWDCGKKIGEST